MQKSKSTTRRTFRLAFDCLPQIFCRFYKSIFGFLHSDRQHSSSSPGAEAPRLKAPLFCKRSPQTRQLRFILHAFGTRPVRIRAPRPIWSIGPNWPLPRPGCWRMRTQSVFHRGHEVSFIAPVAFSVLWLSGRERARLPFRTRSVFRRAGRFLRSVRIVDAGARVACFIAPVAFSVL